LELRALPAGSARAEALCEAATIHLWYGNEGSARGLLAEAWAASEMRPDIGDIWRTAAIELAVRDRDVTRARELELGLRLGEMNPEPAHRARQLAMCAYSALAADAPGADSILAEAQALAYKQEAGFWAGYCRVLRACLGAVRGTFSQELLDATKLDRTYLSVLAEAVTAKLAEADDELLTVVASEVELRPQRWRSPLRTEVESGSSASRWVAARLLDKVGTREDVSRLRLLARSSKGATTDKGLGKGLARRLAPAVRIEDLGRVQIHVDGRSIPGSDIRRKVLALVCYLGSRPAYAATRDQVLEALWPDLEPAVGLNSLNQTIYFLRRVFEPDYEEELSPEYIRHDSNLIWLEPDLVTTRSSECWELTRRIGTGRTEEVVRLSAAYVGRFALDFEYEEWAMPFRDSLHASYLQIIESTVADDMNAGFYSRGIALARRALEIDPHAEQLEVSLLRLYRNSGAHAAAAEQYAHYSSLLRTDLGVEPPPLESI
jgi:DNA-binding SARP family transcriptional activator